MLFPVVHKEKKPHVSCELFPVLEDTRMAAPFRTAVGTLMTEHDSHIRLGVSDNTVVHRVNGVIPGKITVSVAVLAGVRALARW